MFKSSLFAVLMTAFLGTTALTAQDIYDPTWDNKGVGVGFVAESVFNNTMLSGDKSYNNMQGYFVVDMDIAIKNKKFFVGAEARVYTKLLDDTKLYRSSGGVKVGYAIKNVTFTGGISFPITGYDYFQGIFTPAVDIRIGEFTAISLVGNYYTNAKLFQYTSSVGVGLKFLF